jgi:Zn-dependent peptidase ImmA (M78 family)/DNA-binding XRE family transcriptional regulator
MPTKRPVWVGVKSGVMKWARESIGLTIPEVSKRLNIGESTIAEWETGGKKPTLNTLKKLASLYKRPLAIFFLPTPPLEPPLPRDYRVLPEEKRRPLTKQALLAIRRARYLQSVATELLKEEPTGDILASFEMVSLNDDPEFVAERQRAKLGISLDYQQSFRSVYDAFSRWRDVLENQRILVLQSRMSVGEARGFSLTDNLIPVISVNMSDSISARVFTLFHEYAHILTKVSGICTPENISPYDANAQLIERFCNHFAGAFVVPRTALERNINAIEIRRRGMIDNSLLFEIANHFKVSSQVILRRLLICEFINRSQYQVKSDELEFQKGPLKRKTGFGMPTPKRCISENGRLFTAITLAARGRDSITYSDLADYLAIDLKYLDKVEALL